ncbi:MAG: hypothetical protein ACOYXM_01670 [Actinomycetota bacterium]
MTRIVPEPFVLGDTCGDVMVCEVCHRALPFSTYYLATCREGVEGPPWHLACFEAVARAALAAQAADDADQCAEMEAAEGGLGAA